jgi:hypothetical protein
MQRISKKQSQKTFRNNNKTKEENRKIKKAALMGRDLYPSALGRSEQRRARRRSIGIAHKLES